MSGVKKVLLPIWSLCKQLLSMVRHSGLLLQNSFQGGNYANMQWNYQAAVGMQITTTSLKCTEKQSWCLCAFKQDRGSPPHSNFLRLGCGMLVSPLQPLSQKAAGRDHTYHTMNGFSRFCFFSILICCYIQGMPPSDRKQRSTAFFHTKERC